MKAYGIVKRVSKCKGGFQQFKKDYQRFKDELPYSGRWFYKFNNINKDNLLKGIDNFETLLRYISEPKIIKKQKRNDE